MGEKFSEGAIVQHMSKLRGKMVDNNLPVPPPLKRGTTVVPSKIYATSGNARRKSMPSTPITPSASISAAADANPQVADTGKSKPSTTKKRTRRSGVASDSDSQPDDNDMDIADTSDEEYGASGRKKKKQHRKPKSRAASKKNTVQEPVESRNEATEQVSEENALGKSQFIKEESIKESIETPGLASRTRGVRPDYSKLDQVSDDEEVDVDVNDAKDDSAESEIGDEKMDVAENETEDPKVKSDGEVSPRSKVPEAPVTPAHMTVLSPM